MTWLRIAVVALVFVIAAAAFLPLRFVLQFAPIRDPRLDPGFASGTVWSGRLDDVKWQGADLGDFDVAMSPLDLLTGKVRLSFSSEGSVREGGWISTPTGGRFENLKGLIQLDALAPSAPAGSFVSFLDGAADLGPSGCRSAAGRVLVDGLADAGFSAMEGRIGCESGLVVLALQPSTGAPLDLLLDPRNGEVKGRSADAANLAALAALGISPLETPKP
jgi:hypothetical protein